MSAVTHEIVAFRRPVEGLDIAADFVVRWSVEDYCATAEVWSAVISADPPRVEAWNAEVYEPQAIEEATDPVLRATVKWDGCADWDLSPTACQYHTCDAADVRDLAALLVHLQRRALELMPKADPERREEARQ